MDCVKLYFKDSLIGVLTYNNNSSQYVFVKNKFFENAYIQEVMGINDKEVYVSKSLFSFFSTFLKRYGSQGYSDEYEELVNIANLNLDRNQFWIGA